jgi:molybdenum cofactor guanylyltransferase
MNCAIYILAGGKSSRMGIDKALLMLGKQCILQHIIAIAKMITQNVYLVTSNPIYTSFNIPIISDLLFQKGPAGGIDALLHHTKQEYNVVLSCDMPFIDTQSIKILLHHAIGFSITYSVYNQYPEMMFSIFHKNCRDNWRNHILKNELKLSTLIAHFHTNELDSGILVNTNPKLFININTLDDYQKALSYFSLNGELSLNEMNTLLQHPYAQIIDVRNKDEMPKLNRPTIVNMPMNQLRAELTKLDATKPTIFICHAGIRSHEALLIAQDEFHFANAFHLKGGIVKYGNEIMRK